MTLLIKLVATSHSYIEYFEMFLARDTPKPFVFIWLPFYNQFDQQGPCQLK